MVLSAELLVFLEIIQKARPSAEAAIQSGPNSLGYAASRPVGTAMAVLIGTPAMRAKPSLLTENAHCSYLMFPCLGDVRVAHGK